MEWFKKQLKVAAVVLIISPVCFLTYHRAVAEYIDWLWPELDFGPGFVAALSVVAALVSGLIIGAIVASNKN